MTVVFDQNRAEGLKVEESYRGGHVMSVARALSEDEILLAANPETEAQHQRFVWLKMELGADSTISALGEIVDQGPECKRIRFKHIFPDYKRMLQEYLSGQQVAN